MIVQSGSKIRIAILLGAPFTEQNFERVGISYLSPHFEIMVFDCLDWLGRNADEIKCKRAQWGHCTIINTELDFEIAINKYKPDYVINYVDTRIFTSNIKNVLVKAKAKFVAQKTGNLPSLSIVNRIKKFDDKRSLIGNESAGVVFDGLEGENKKIICHNMVILYTTKFVNKLKQLITIRAKVFPDISLLAGDKSLDYYTKKASQIIWIGSNDYHQFNKAKFDLISKVKLHEQGGFILFIDDALPYANDWILLNIKPPVTAAKYYPVLRLFFEKIESQFGLPVVIAGHPNSESDSHYSTNLGGRNIMFGETASLAIQSTLVLIHGSTAVSFAVLARKPTLFITTRELDNSRYGMYVKTMAKSLGSPLIFMDEPDSHALGLPPPVINVKKYKLYESNYIRSEHSNESAPWQSFINYVNEKSTIDLLG